MAAKNTVTKSAPVAASAPTYVLSAKAQAIAATVSAPRLTPQGAKSGLGRQWHSKAVKAPNTRALVLAKIAELGAPFTGQQAQSALEGMRQAGVLGSGTPRSYVVAFIANGYFAESK